jgi:hypothetical protein
MRGKFMFLAAVKLPRRKVTIEASGLQTIEKLMMWKK